jgi:hypothetical protein
MGEQEANMAQYLSTLGGRAMKSFVDTERKQAFDDLLLQGTKSTCQLGRNLLRSFAESRPADFSFLQADDLSSGADSAFAGIPEWDAFQEHYASCRRCHA